VDGAQLALMRGLLPLCESLAVACNVAVPAGNSSARALQWTACLNAYIFCNMGTRQHTQRMRGRRVTSLTSLIS
jgi:hypothetical protein